MQNSSIYVQNNFYYKYANSNGSEYKSFEPLVNGQQKHEEWRRKKKRGNRTDSQIAC
jgi:hypothetical protein